MHNRTSTAQAVVVASATAALIIMGAFSMGKQNAADSSEPGRMVNNMRVPFLRVRTPIAATSSAPIAIVDAECNAWSCSCQMLSDMTGANHALRIWGTSTKEQRRWWVQHRCTTSAHADVRGVPPVGTQRVCPFTPPLVTSSAGDTKTGTVQANGGWTYTVESVAQHHVAFDPGLGKALSVFLGNASIYDIGAGVGQLGRYFQSIGSNVDYAGFDGGNNIEQLWGKNFGVRGDRTHVVPRVCWIDASVPVTLPKRDWVVSIEVGEHIPAAHEGTFLDNLVTMSQKGVILSWALKGQGGRSHVNEQNNDHVIEQMARRGMHFDAAKSAAFRKSVCGRACPSGAQWLKATIMVFRF